MDEAPEATTDAELLVEQKAQLKIRARLKYPACEIEVNIESSAELIQARKFHKKEVETQRWIEGFAKGDVFYDVGANSGLFSLLAACQPGKQHIVVAFEPTFASFHSFCQSLQLNGVAERVIPLLCGLSDATKIDRLNFRRMEAGTAKSVVGEAIDYRGLKFAPRAMLLVPTFRLDDAVRIFDLPPPNHLKIDVDGIELKILAGARETLADRRLRSVMVEANGLEMEEQLQKIMEASGFRLTLRQKKKIGPAIEGHTRNNYFER